MKTIFVKVNNQYREDYQIKTRILSDGEKKYVVKESVSEHSYAHILNMYEGQEKLSKAFPQLSVNSCTKHGNGVRFKFAEGSPLTQVYADCVEKGDHSRFFETLQFHINLITNDRENRVSFRPCSEFEAIFGSFPELDGVDAQKMAVFDGTANNIIISSGHPPVLIDYEWCFSFPLPTDYVKYRVLKRLYSSDSRYEEFEPFISTLSVLNLGLDTGVWEKMEENFFHHIITRQQDSSSIVSIMSKYQKRTKTIKDVEQENTQLKKDVWLKNTEFSMVKTSLDWHMERVSALEKAIKWHEEKEQQLEDSLEWHKNYLKQLEDSLEWHKNYLKQLEDSSRWNNEYVKELKSSIGWYEDKTEAYEKAIQWHKEHDAGLEKKNTEQYARIQELEAYIVEQSEAMHALQEKNVSLQENLNKIERHVLGKIWTRLYGEAEK